jgi:omega-6 fatty acid desaturase (delta-12 desaturase)
MTRDPAPFDVRGRLRPEHRRRALLPGLLSFLVPLAAFAGLLAAVVLAPWWAKVPLGALTGIAIGVMFIVGHDACHGILLPRRWQNRLAGRVCLLPALHPYTAWKHNHNGLHHAFTNLKEKDPGFPPLSPAEYRALSGWGRLLYRVNRKWYGLGLLYFVEMWLKWEVLPAKEHSPRNPKAYNRDRLLVAAFAVAWVGGLAAAGWFLDGSALAAVGLVLVGFVLPYAVWNWLIGFIILQQHTHPRVAWYSEKDFPDPTYFQMQVNATPHLIFPRPFRWVMRHVMEHTAHHADPAVPLYQLTDAQAVLDKAYRTEIVRQYWSVRGFLTTLRVCKLYDYDAHRWVDYDGTPLSEPLYDRRHTPAKTEAAA